MKSFHEVDDSQKKPYFELKRHGSNKAKMSKWLKITEKAIVRVHRM